MNFPKKRFFGLLNNGWEDRGAVEDRYISRDGSLITYEKTIHNMCGTRIHIGRENETVFHFCPKCLVVIGRKPMTLPELPSDFKELPLDDRIKILLTNWIHRMDSLGELQNFVNRKAGWWVFDCPELQEEIATTLETEVQKAGLLNELSGIDGVLEGIQEAKTLSENQLSGREDELIALRRSVKAKLESLSHNKEEVWKILK